MTSDGVVEYYRAAIISGVLLILIEWRGKIVFDIIGFHVTKTIYKNIRAWTSSMLSIIANRF